MYWSILGWGASLPLPLALPGAVVAALTLLGLFVWRTRSTDLEWRGAAKAFGLFLLAVPATYIPTLMVEKLRSAWTPIPSSSVSDPVPTFLGFVLLGIASSLWIFGGLRRRSGDAETFSGLWLGWALLTLLAARFVPAASYLFLLPLLLATGLALLLARKFRSRADLLFAGPGLFTTLLFLPHLVLPLDLLGLAALPLIATLVCMATSPAVRA